MTLIMNEDKILVLLDRSCLEITEFVSIRRPSATSRVISMVTATVTRLRPKMDEKHIHYLVL